MKKGKRYLEAAKLVDRMTTYEAAEAVSLVKKCASAKFDETIEAHIRLGVHSSILAWEIPWTEDQAGYSSWSHKSWT